MSELNFSYESNSSTSYLVYKIKNVDKIDNLEHNMLINNKIEGLLEVLYSSIDENSYYKFNISSKITLNRYLEGGISKNNLFKTLLSLLKTLIEIDDYLILKEHIILDDNYVFIDVSTNCLYFVCLPIEFNDVKFNLKYFIERILFDAINEKEENLSYISILKSAINNEKEIDIYNFLEIVKKLYDNIDKKIYEHKEKSIEKENNNDTINHTDKRNIKKLDNEKILSSNENKNIEFSVPKKSKGSEDIKAKGKNDSKLKDLLKLPNMKKEKSNIKKVKDNVKKEKIHIDSKIDLDINSDEEDFSHTVLIKNGSNSENTIILGALTSGLYPKNPYIIRQTTNEKIFIDKELFKIGKESNYVDYAITDNNTISRSHADILKINKDYYIQDNNSKNHTYVNNNLVCNGEVIKLEHNCEIRLSDEKFIFKLY